MSSWLTDINGAQRKDTSAASLNRLLDDLANNADEEHFSVSVTNGGWNLGLYRDLVVLEDVEENDTERHMVGVDREECVALATALIAGDLDSVKSRPWVPGYGS